MNKFISLLLALTLLISFTACGNADTPSTDPDGSEDIQPDEGSSFVDITLPQSFFEDVSADEIQKEAEQEEGIHQCVVNADGSVTFTMTKAKHQETMDELDEGMEESISMLLEGELAVASFVSIEHSDDFSRFDIFVDESYSALDSFYSLSLFVSGALYQIFNGVDEEDVDVTVYYIDNASKELLDSASYRDWMKASEDA